MTGCATVDCLLTVNTTELEIIAAKVPLQPGSFSTQWGPVVDGVELLGLPMDLAAKGEIASLVPTLLGTNHDEGSMFVPCSHTGSNACTESYVRGQHGCVAWHMRVTPLLFPVCDETGSRRASCWRCCTLRCRLLRVIGANICSPALPRGLQLQ